MIVLYYPGIDLYTIYPFMSVFFFFKQKTAYEMRISDWSSDVCSSDLRTKYLPWRRGKAAASRTDRRYSLHPKATSIDEIGAKRRDDLQQTSWKGAFAHTKRLLEGDRLWVRDARGQPLQEPCHFYLPPLLAHPHRSGRRSHPWP